MMTTKHRTETPAIRWHVSYFDRCDPGDPTSDSDNYFMMDPFYNENEARRAAADKTRDGWEVCLASETVEEFINDSCRFASTDRLLSLLVKRFHEELFAGDRDDAEIVRLLTQAKQIGQQYGTVSGYLASGWDGFVEMAEEAMEQHKADGVLPVVIIIAQVFARAAFWRARREAFIGLTRG